MMVRELDLVERVLEDDGLVEGLPPAAAHVVRNWCLQRVREIVDACGAEGAESRTDEVVARARTITQVVAELTQGRSSLWLAARLNRVVPDGAHALLALQAARPLEDRLTEVLAQVPLHPCS
jgi:hypothetical protein